MATRLRRRAARHELVCIYSIWTLPRTRRCISESDWIVKFVDMLEFLRQSLDHNGNLNKTPPCCCCMLVCVCTGWLSGYGDGSLEHLTAWASTFKIEDPNGGDTPYAAPYGVKGRCHNDPGSQNPNTRFECTQCETCLPRCSPSDGCIDRDMGWRNGNVSLPTKYNMTRKDGPRCETGSSFGPSMTCTQAGSYPGAYGANRLVFRSFAQTQVPMLAR